MGWTYLKIVVVCLGIYFSYLLVQQTDALNRDSLEQMRAGISFATRGDFSTPKAIAVDLAKSVYFPLEGWPLSYSRLFGVFMKGGFSAEDIRSILNFVSVLLFFASWVFILSQISTRLQSRALLGVVLFWLFGFPPFLERLSTDHLSLALFSAGYALCLRASAREYPSLALNFAGGLLTSAAATLRYAYLPLPFLLGSSLLFMTWKERNTKWRVFSAYAMGVLSAGSLIVLTELEGISALASPSAGWHWDQLRGFHPFLPAFLGLNRLFPTLLEKIGVSIDTKLAIYWIVSAIIATISIFGLLELRHSKNLSQRFFYLVGISVLVGVPTSLIFISLADKFYAYPGFSILGTPRYFAPIIPFVLIFFSLGMTSRRSPKYLKGIGASIIAIVVVNIAGWHVWRATKVFSCGYFVPTLKYYQENQSLDRLTTFLSQKGNSGEKIFFIDEDPIRGNFLTLSGAFCLPTPQFSSSMPFSVLVIRSLDNQKAKTQCSKLSSYGENPVARADLSEFVEQIGGREVLTSNHWRAFEGVTPVNRQVRLPESLGCITNPGQWNYYSIASTK